MLKSHLSPEMYSIVSQVKNAFMKSTRVKNTSSALTRTISFLNVVNDVRRINLTSSGEHLPHSAAVIFFSY